MLAAFFIPALVFLVAGGFAALLNGRGPGLGPLAVCGLAASVLVGVRFTDHRALDPDFATGFDRILDHETGHPGLRIDRT